MSTAADIYALSDGERAELIDGVIYHRSPPGPLKMTTGIGKRSTQGSTVSAPLNMTGTKLSLGG